MRGLSGSNADPVDERAPARVIDISSAAIVKVLAAAVLVWVWLRLWRWILLFIVGAFLAVALDPFVIKLERAGLRRHYAAPLLMAGITGALVAFAYLCGSSLIEQSQYLGSRIQVMQQDLISRVPPELAQLMPGAASAADRLASYALAFARALTSGVLLVAVAFLITVYLLVDGRRTYEWIVAFVPPAQRPRVQLTAREAMRAIRAYVQGNVITSVFAALFTGIVLAVLHVPAVLLLALLAGICDFVPVVGFIMSAGPAVLLALTVSTTTAFLIAGLYVLYHAVENYVIGPRVYGHELRLSDLAVIVAFAIGAELGGVVGALIVLPLAAIYPVVERVWLADRFANDVRAEHRRVEETQPH